MKLCVTTSTPATLAAVRVGHNKMRGWPAMHRSMLHKLSSRMLASACKLVLSAQAKQLYQMWPGYQLACTPTFKLVLLLCLTDPNFARGACRLEEAQEAAAGLREQLTEARRHLREVMDEEKEHKKKRRAAALALATVRPCCYRAF
jgi:hypothetical protein